MQKSFEQQPDESGANYNAFQKFLELRCVKSVSKVIQKSYSATRRIASKFDWAARAAAFDSFNLEQARRKIVKDLATNLLQNWTDNNQLQAAAFDALNQKDLSKCGFKTLNEIYAGTFERQIKLLEVFKVLDSVAADDDQNNLMINIIPVHRKED